MYVIRITHNNRVLSIGQYVQLIKSVKAAPKGTQYKETLCSSFGGTRETILAEFGQMVQDKINEHLKIRSLSDRRLSRKMRAKIKSSCRWCGSNLNRYEPYHNRFCDSSCHRSYYY